MFISIKCFPLAVAYMALSLGVQFVHPSEAKEDLSVNIHGYCLGIIFVNSLIEAGDTKTQSKYYWAYLKMNSDVRYNRSSSELAEFDIGSAQWRESYQLAINEVTEDGVTGADIRRMGAERCSRFIDLQE